MPELVLDLMKFVFLAILYIFIARVVRAIYLEPKQSDVRPSRAAPAPPSQQSRRSKKAPNKAAITEGPAKGKTLNLDGEITIGRSDKCSLVLDDTYVSQIHARLFSRGDSIMVEDLGSTNGTYVNRRRITAPAELRRGDQVKIGKSVLEMRR
ncbi:MAG: FHA domain-containing protein FhaB/FipA [Actinomycetota bacterium]